MLVCTWTDLEIAWRKVLYIWFEAFPIVFSGMHHFSLGLSGLAFVGLLVGAFLVIPPFFWFVYKFVEPQFDQTGSIPPEKRLTPVSRSSRCISPLSNSELTDLGPLWRYFCTNLPFLVWLERSPRYPLDHAYNRLIIFYRKGFTLFIQYEVATICTNIHSVRRFSGLSGCIELLT